MIWGEIDAIISAGWKSVPPEEILDMCGLMPDGNGGLTRARCAMCGYLDGSHAPQCRVAQERKWPHLKEIREREEAKREAERTERRDQFDGS